LKVERPKKWNKKMLEEETQLDPNQWDKMQAMLNGMDDHQDSINSTINSTALKIGGLIMTVVLVSTAAIFWIVQSNTGTSKINDQKAITQIIAVDKSEDGTHAKNNINLDNKTNANPSDPAKDILNSDSVFKNSTNTNRINNESALENSDGLLLNDDEIVKEISLGSEEYKWKSTDAFDKVKGLSDTSITLTDDYKSNRTIHTQERDDVNSILESVNFNLDQEIDNSTGQAYPRKFETTTSFDLNQSTYQMLNNPIEKLIYNSLGELSLPNRITDLRSQEFNFVEVKSPGRPNEVKVKIPNKKFVELYYFHNKPAVFGAKLFYKRTKCLSPKLEFTYGIGSSFTRGIEGYRNNIIITTDTSVINRQEGYSLHVEMNLGSEITYRINKFGFRTGFELSYAVYNSLRTAESESFFDPDKEFKFIIYQNGSEFDNINRLGFILNAGIDFHLSDTYRIGLGFHKRLNPYFKDTSQLDINKNNIAPEFEIRVARYF